MDSDNPFAQLHSYLAGKLSTPDGDKGRVADFVQLLQTLTTCCASQAVTAFLSQASSFQHRNPLKGNRYEQLRAQLRTLPEPVLQENFRAYSDYLKGRNLLAPNVTSDPNALARLRDRLCAELGWGSAAASENFLPSLMSREFKLGELE